jgi:cytochrome c oxidase assembly protein subunit 15
MLGVHSPLNAAQDSSSPILIPNWVRTYARVLVLATFWLIFVGGLVTSKDAGLAVPDWPLSFGSVNPPGWWEQELVRLEHGHRLYAAGVGLLTIGLAVILWIKAPHLRWFGITALLLVCLQGYLGGRRVTDKSLELAIIHGCTAQIFLCLLVFIAAALSPFWRKPPAMLDTARFTRNLGGIVTILIFAQLILGAIMRHYKAGLAIPDFPLSYGKWIPDLQVWAVQIHYAHRVGALIVAIGVAILVTRVLRAHRQIGALAAPAVTLALLVLLQITLGASVIWMQKAPVPTTFHVLNGAAVLATSFLITLRAARLSSPAAALSGAPASLQHA